jgi:hypothetical protein
MICSVTSQERGIKKKHKLELRGGGMKKKPKKERVNYFFDILC